MKWVWIGTAVAALTIAVATSPVYGQEPGVQSGKDKATSQRPAETSAQAARADAQAFVNDMTIAGLAEVQLGKIATERAANADVKAFGQMMVDDHTEAGNELKQVAMQLKLQQPAQLEQKHKDLVDKLSKLQGAEFDREYMNAMVQGHQEVLGKLRARVEIKVPAPGAAASEHPVGEHPLSSTARGQGTETSKPPAQNPGVGDTTGRGHGEHALTQWAAMALPTVQKHLDRARELQQKVAK
jgi:putative membrane protein